VVSNLGRDKNAIFEYDVENGKLGKLIFEHPDVDVSYLIRSKARKVITGAAYVTDKTTMSSSTPRGSSFRICSNRSCLDTRSELPARARMKRNSWS